MLRSLKQHVLQEMGHSLLVLFLHQRPRALYQPELANVLLVHRSAHIVGETIGQNALTKGCVCWNDLFRCLAKCCKGSGHAC